jgi:CRP-like cAMP-binding protein
MIIIIVFRMNTDLPLKYKDCETCLLRMLCTQALSPEEFDIIDKTAVKLKFIKGETLIKQGSTTTHIVYLSKGVVKHNYENETGKNLILTISSAPYFLGGANIFNDGVNLFSIWAIEECEACLIDIQAIKQVIRNNGEISLKLFAIVSEMFKSSIFNFISMAHKHVNGRIADIFLYLSKSVYKNNKFTLSLTRKEISEFAGVSQENVITTMSKLNKEGIIKVEGKNIEILNFEKLTHISKTG